MLTLVSRPVIGAPSCAAASAFGSIDASRPRAAAICSGRSPGYWKNHSSWPAGYVSSTPGNTLARSAPPTQFNDVFGKSGGYPAMSLLDVLNQGGGGAKALARQIVAALLNAAQGLTPPTVLSVATVKAIWTSFVLTGYYSPTPGVKWDAREIIVWLKTTTT